MVKKDVIASVFTVDELRFISDALHGHEFELFEREIPVFNRLVADIDDALEIYAGLSDEE